MTQRLNAASSASVVRVEERKAEEVEAAKNAPPEAAHKKLAELEKEQVRQRAEEERLESEAEEERNRIEQRMLELKAEEERRRQKKRRIGAGSRAGTSAGRSKTGGT